MSHEIPATTDSAVLPRLKRRPAVMAALLFVVLIPPLFLCGLFARQVAEHSTFGALGTAFARWRYQERFERQYADLMDCLDQRLPLAAGADFVEVGNSCSTLADSRSVGPVLAIHVLVSLESEPTQWHSVWYADDSVLPPDLHERELGEGLHLVSMLSGRGLLYHRTLLVHNELAAQPQAYTVLAPLSGFR